MDDLSDDAIAELQDEIIAVNSKAFGIDMTPFWSARRGGIRSLDGVFAARDAGELVGFLGYLSYSVGGRRLLYIDATGVLDAYRRQKIAFTLAGRALMWFLGAHGYEPIWVGLRTPNPAVADAITKAVRRLDHLPRLHHGGNGSPMELEVVQRWLADKLSPECQFRPEVGVIEGAFGDLFKQVNFNLANVAEPVRLLFEREIDLAQGDGLLVVFGWDAGAAVTAVYPERQVKATYVAPPEYLFVEWSDDTDDGPSHGLTMMQVDESGAVCAWRDLVEYSERAVGQWRADGARSMPWAKH